MLPTDHQLTIKKMARVPPGGALPLEKKIGKGKEMLPTDHQFKKKNGESSPWGGPPPEKRIWQRRGNASGRPPIQFIKKWREFPLGGPAPWKKNLAKERKCFRQTTN